MEGTEEERGEGCVPRSRRTRGGALAVRQERERLHGQKGAPPGQGPARSSE